MKTAVRIKYIAADQMQLRLTRVHEIVAGALTRASGEVAASHIPTTKGGGRPAPASLPCEACNGQ